MNYNTQHNASSNYFTKTSTSLCLFLWNKLIIGNCDLVHSGEFTGFKNIKDHRKAPVAAISLGRFIMPFPNNLNS